MDPTDVLRAVWQQRRYVLPALLVALVAVGYVFQFAPRSYESTATWALVNPAVPTQEELDTDPDLAALNADNPYLRSTDANLVTDAVIARLGAPSTVKALEAAGVGTEFAAGPGAGGNGFVIDVTGMGPTPEASIATAVAVGDVLQRELHDLQTVNGADDRYLFTPLLITPAEDATEKFSSRLRAVIVVLIGGAVLVFGAVSLGRYVDRARGQRRDGGAEDSGPGPDPAAAEAVASGPLVAADGVVAFGPPVASDGVVASGPPVASDGVVAFDGPSGVGAPPAPAPAGGAAPPGDAGPPDAPAGGAGRARSAARTTAHGRPAPVASPRPAPARQPGSPARPSAAPGGSIDAPDAPGSPPDARRSSSGARRSPSGARAPRPDAPTPTASAPTAPAPDPAVSTRPAPDPAPEPGPAPATTAAAPRAPAARATRARTTGTPSAERTPRKSARPAQPARSTDVSSEPAGEPEAEPVPVPAADRPARRRSSTSAPAS